MPAVAEVAHGDVVPITRQRRLASLGGGDDFAAAAGGVAEIGAEDGAAVAGAVEVERDRQRVARDLEQAGAGRRMLLKRHGWTTFTNADTEGSTSIFVPGSLHSTLNSRPDAIRRFEGKTAETAYDVYRQRVPDGPYAVKLEVNRLLGWSARLA